MTTVASIIFPTAVLDIFGSPVAPGDYVVKAGRRGSSSKLTVYKVLEFAAAKGPYAATDILLKVKAIKGTFMVPQQTSKIEARDLLKVEVPHAFKI